MTFVWLASYPKSGNTWLRIFLTNYVRNSEEPVGLNEPLLGDALHLDRHLFDEEMGVTSSELAPAEQASLRTKYHARFMAKHNHPAFAKMHEAYQEVGRKPVLPQYSHCKIIYLARNPLDIVSSYANHQGDTADGIISHMADEKARVRYGETSFSEYLGPWGQHVLSWTRQNTLPMFMIRYEDILANPHARFSEIVSFCDLEFDEDRLQKSVAFSGFRQLHELELKNGYRDRPASCPQFFRSGMSGGWRKELSGTQIEQIKSDHGAAMTLLNYR